jgi:hypothetical protein
MLSQKWKLYVYRKVEKKDRLENVKRDLAKRKLSRAFNAWGLHVKGAAAFRRDMLTKRERNIAFERM